MPSVDEELAKPEASALQRRILLVDDSKTFQSLFKASLGDCDCALFVCNDGREALDLIASQYIDFICSSYFLRDLEGIELCRRVRLLTKNASKPFVLLTSVDSADALTKALPAGVTDIFHRNDVEQLLAFIKRFPSSHARIAGRVLYVEDNKSQRAALKAILESRGLRVDAFASADEALRNFRNQDYDLVLTDIVLDGTMSGLALVNQIRRQTSAKGDTPIIAVTAFDDKTRRIELFNLGVTDYILKPVAEEELFARIGSLLEMRRLALEIERERQQRHADELTLSDARFQTLFANMAEGVALHELVYGADGRAVDYRLLNVNPAYAGHTGLTAAQLLGKLASEAFGTPEAPFLDTYAGVVETRHPAEFEPCPAGIEKQLRIRAYAMQDGHFATMVEDITERKQAEAELRIAATAFESQDGMMITDAHGVILRVNRAFVAITGYSPEEAVGQTPRLLQSGRHNADFYRALWTTLLRTGSWQGEIWDRRKNGEVYLKWLTISAVKADDGTVTHYIGVHFDITERKKAEEEIRKLAFFDQLTDLPNRALLLDRLKQAMVASGRNETHGALLFIDLDNFKTLNDTLGHDIGDLLLKQAAERLIRCVREGDTIARLGGDEFVVILASLDANEREAASATEAVAGNILAALAEVYQLGRIVHRSTASIGATLFKGPLISIDELMKQADLTMYKAKAAGRNTLRFFDPEMEVAVKERAALEDDLRQALAEQQFLLHYQPQVAGDGGITGAEALLRWPHPRRGNVPPVAFIPLAEETGLILPLGNWVLETACTQLARWATRPETAHLTLAVNVSAHQFHQADFVGQVLTALERSDANPQRLKLELTESLLVANVDDIIAKMSTLKEKGVCFSLDDFGTGYSSLSYLKQLPLDQLKIDQSFVRDILIDPNDAAIARTIVALAQSLGLGVIAEGVETAAQRDFLASSGCHAYQGYFFGRPLPLDDFEGLLNADASATERSAP
jgi:diguanylate cyclase (GGDEF)-like protein/PAS domain S-box-containing protein